MSRLLMANVFAYAEGKQCCSVFTFYSHLPKPFRALSRDVCYDIWERAIVVEMHGSKDCGLI